MDLQTILDFKFQGLPGLGVNAGTGDAGTKGQSVYVGHIKDFFDTRKLTDEELVYIREKNTAENPSYYFDSSNFYTELGNDVKRLTEFTIYSLNYIRSENYDGKFEMDFDRESSPTAGYVVDLLTGKANPELFTENIHKVHQNQDYLNTRDINSSKFGYSDRNTEDVVIPTVLSSIYRSGDMLYILDDVTDKIASEVTLTSDLTGMSFMSFLKQTFLNISSVISSISTDGRIRINRDMVIPQYHVSDLLLAQKSAFLSNFISHESGDYPLSIATNVKDSWRCLTMTPDASGYLSIDYDNATGAFVISSDSIMMQNLYLPEDIVSNVNIPGYNDSSYVISDGCRLAAGCTAELIDGGIRLGVERSVLTSDDSSLSCYSLTVYKADGSVYRKTAYAEANTTDSSLSVTLVNSDFSPSVINDYMLVLAASVCGTFTRYSSPSELSIKTDASCGIVSYTLSDGDSADMTGSTDASFGFTYQSMDCNECDDNSLVISGDSSLTINYVYVNGICFVKAGGVVSDASVNSWLTAAGPVFENNTLRLPFTATANIPYGTMNGINVPKCSTVKDFLAFSSRNFEIDQTITQSSQRTVSVLVTGCDAGGVAKKAEFSIMQHGFTSPVTDISAGLTALSDVCTLEKSNASSAGVLCNQLQFFTEMSFSGFSADTWGSYLSDASVTAFVKPVHNILQKRDGYSYFNTVNNNNVHIYSKSDISKYENGVSLHLGWIPETDSEGNATGISYDSSVTFIDSIENSFGGRLEYCMTNADSSVLSEKWIPFESSLGNTGSEIPNDINFGADCSYGFSVQHITTQIASSPVLLRVLLETGNPVPMEFNWKWSLTRIEISGVYDGSVFTFHKDFGNATASYDDYTEGVYSDNMKFIVNPVSMTLAPASSETGLSDISGSAIKITGNEDNIRVHVGFVDIDASVRSEYSANGYENIDVRHRVYASKQSGINCQIPDIAYYYPKAAYFQDNISSLYVSPKSLCDTSTLASGSEFMQFITSENTVSSESYLRNYSDMYVLDMATQLSNVTRETEYVSLFYRGEIMNPVKRQGTHTFYYNNVLYPLDEYCQWSDRSPLTVKQDASVRLMDDMLTTSKQIWNYEYEASSTYNSTLVSGGVITQSGNGYLYASDSLDISQYTDSEAYTLAKTKLLAGEYVMTDGKDVSICSPTGFNAAPADGKMFRTLLYDAYWSYNCFVTENSILKTYPYNMVNSYMEHIDVSVMSDYISTGLVSTADAYIMDSSADIKSKYLAGEDYFRMKIKNKSVGTGTDGNLTLISKRRAGMMIPYNLLYDVYPRIADNTDTDGKCVNVMMLQTPTVTDSCTYTLNRRYYGIADYDGTDVHDNATIPLLPPLVTGN